MVLDAVLEAIETNQLLATSANAIVAVSGGCDSVALLHSLRSLQTRLGLELHVASLDHGIRGAAGRADLEFVRDLAAGWNLPCIVGRVDAPRLARERSEGLEAAARRARYDFLARAAISTASDIVFAGHHANDQAETILMRILRGTGVRGLRGMQTVSSLPNHPEITLVRPLLKVSRAELETYCADHGLRYRQDETNAETQYARNFLRHTVMDKLQALNPDVLNAFARLAEAAAVDEDYMTTIVESEVLPRIERSADFWRIDKSTFQALHPALRRRLLRQAFGQLTQGNIGMSYSMTLKLLGWAETAQTGSSVDIGAELQLRMDYESIIIMRKHLRIEPPGYRLIPAWTDVCISASKPYVEFGLRISIAPDARRASGKHMLLLRSDSDLRLRTRRPGDRFKPKGMGGHSKKLKDWMIDRKVPRYARDQIPLLCADGAIVAICIGANWRLAELEPPPSTDSTTTTVILE